jgi:hypothetical protein
MPTPTNFPNGITSPFITGASGGSLPGVPGFNGAGGGNVTLGAVGGSQVFYVNSTAAQAVDGGTNGSSPETPFKSINFAVTRCIANNGDMIFVGPGHVESVVGAAGLTFGTAGISVVFQGIDSERASISLGTSTAAQVVVSAANVSLINPRFVNSIDALVAAISVTAANFKMYNAKYVDGVATGTLIQILTNAAGAAGLKLYGYEFNEPASFTGTQKTEAIRIVGGGAVLLNNVYISGSFSTAPFNNITTAINNVVFDTCVLSNTNATAKICIAILTTSTGFIRASLLSYQATHAITTAHILSADMASGQCVPGATPTVIGHA